MKELELENLRLNEAVSSVKAKLDDYLNKVDQ